MLEEAHRPYAKLLLHVGDSPGFGREYMAVKGQCARDVGAMRAETDIGININRRNVPLSVKANNTRMNQIPFKHKEALGTESLCQPPGFQVKFSCQQRPEKPANHSSGKGAPDCSPRIGVRQ